MERGGKRTGQGVDVSGFLSVVLAFLLWIGAGGSPGEMGYRFRDFLRESAQEMYLPILTWQEKSSAMTAKHWMQQKIYAWIPLLEYIQDGPEEETFGEDEETIARILAAQAEDENTADDVRAPEQKTEESVPSAAPTMDLSIEKLRDFDYLLSNFYTVDSSTMIGPDQLNADDLLGRSMKINREVQGPKVLIFHTHSQEEFADSIPGDPSTSIVGIGEYLAQLLNERGIPAIHDTGVYDIIDGKLDRSNAYENAEASVRPILEANPSVEVAIDLHRDGVAEGTRLVTEIDGKPTAKLMYFNGLSRTRTNGDIDYLYNPYIQDNLAFSLQMQLASENMYPGLVRRIYLRAYRYNLHLLPKSLLVEAGAQTNTVEEMKHAMEALADVLCQVIK